MNELEMKELLDLVEIQGMAVEEAFRRLERVTIGEKEALLNFSAVAFLSQQELPELNFDTRVAGKSYLAFQNRWGN